MLVLTSFGLVLIATALLVFGLLQDDGLTLIYISIACSLAAGIVLVVATRANKKEGSSLSGSGTSSPALPAADVAPEPEPAPLAAATTAPTPAEAAPIIEEVEEEEEPVAESSFAPTAAVPVADSGEPFPIADYDDLSVGEILPLLPKLYVDELDVVDAQERAGKNRSQVTSKLAELRQAAAGAPDDLTIEEYLEQQGAGADDALESIEDVPVVAAAPARKSTASTKKVVKAAPAKKATTAAKKASAPPKKVATTAKKAAAPAKKTATKATAAKKAAPAKKAATKTTAAKKAAPGKKAAAPAKKATKTTKATKKS